MSANLILTLLVAGTAAFNTGPPVVDNPDVCGSMYPFGHGVPASEMASPYVIVPSSTCFKAGMNIDGKYNLHI